MASVASVLDDLRVPAPRVYGDGTHVDFSQDSGVSWAAIFAGAAAAAALSLILVVLGSGLGFSAVSPWALRGISGESLGISAIVWLCVTAIAASGLGGYLAGRLRTKWPTLHTDEVYFRDTAHGFLAWAVATLITAGVLVSTIGSFLAVGTTAAGGVAGAAATSGFSSVAAAPGVGQSLDNSHLRSLTVSGSSESGAFAPYLLDSLFRAPAGSTTQPVSSGAGSANTDNPSNNASGKAEAGRILANALRTGQLTQDDLAYAGRLVAQSTGLSESDAEKRVTDLYNSTAAKVRAAQTEAKSFADQASKATANAMLWIFVSLLVGAFSASLMATFGGRRRDVY